MDELIKVKEYNNTWPKSDYKEQNYLRIEPRRLGVMWITAIPSPPPPLTGLEKETPRVSPMPLPFHEFQLPREITLEEKVRYEDLFKSITNFVKQYGDADRYGGASYENFDDLALTFAMRCRSSGILDAKDLPEVFHVILKGMALAYFFCNYKGKGFIIKVIYTIMRSRFYTHEHAMALERQWDFLMF